MKRFRRKAGSERGFSLIELLTVLLLTAILATLGGFAIRHFWFVRALEGGKNEMITQLRRQQQRVIAETHPLVYGVRYPKGGSQTVRSSFYLVRFDGNNLATETDDTCTQYQAVGLGTGMQIKSANTRAEGVGFADAAYVTDFCRINLEDSSGSSVPGSANDHYGFFFARGTATPGEVTLEQRHLGRTETICVSGLTGRVYVEDEDNPCPD